MKGGGESRMKGVNGTSHIIEEENRSSFVNFSPRFSIHHHRVVVVVVVVVTAAAFVRRLFRCRCNYWLLVLVCIGLQSPPAKITNNTGSAAGGKNILLRSSRILLLYVVAAKHVLNKHITN